MKPKDLYAEAVRQYGKQMQLTVCMEEMAELTKELSKNIRGFQNRSAIAEEIADVEIMLEQIRIIFSCRSDVDRIKGEKLARLADRLEGRYAK